MDYNLNNFGPRLRALVEGRGTIEQAYAEIGVSRATLFNWFDRDTPPPGKVKVEKLRQYLGKDAAWLLDGVQEADPHSLDGPIAEPAMAPTGTPPDLKRKITHHIGSLLKSAGNDVQRLGWIAEQLRQHVSEPSHWGMKERIMQEVLEDQRRKEEREAQEAHSKSGHGRTG